MELAAEWFDLAERLMIRLYRTVPAPVIPHDAATIAHHEAGHVVLAELIGTPATGATITPTAPGCIGLTWHGDTTQPRALSEPLAVQPVAAFADCKLQVFQMAAVRFAGRQAEFLLHDVDPHGFVDGDTHDDLTGAALLSLAFVGADRHSYPRGGAQALARLMLLRHWAAVSRIADALLQHGTIDAGQIKHALAGCLSFGVARAADCATTRTTDAGFLRCDVRDSLAPDLCFGRVDHGARATLKPGRKR